jgi:transposase InsO family protein
MIYAWIKQHSGGGGGGDWPVAVMCQTLGVSRSGYYDWRTRPPSTRLKRREELADQIRQAHAESGQAYGSPRVYIELAQAGVAVCVNTVARVMRDQGIRSVRARKFRVRTTNSAHAHPIADNLLNRDFTADLPDQKWAADISYIETDQGWLYIAGVIDLCSRRIVGWAMADHMKADLCLDALIMALARRKPNLAGDKEGGGGSEGSGGGLIHHSDRGVQYACGAYRELLDSRGLACSMSRRGDCYDNAAMESFWATLKTELVYPGGGYATRAQATASIFKWIECWYNRKRRHSALGYKSPDEFERELN